MAAMHNYDEPQIFEVFKKSTLTFVLFLIEDLSQAVETGKGY